MGRGYAESVPQTQLEQMFGSLGRGTSNVRNWLNDNVGIPFVDTGVGLGDIAIGQAPEMLNDMSWGKSPILPTGHGGKLDPRIADVIDIAALAGIPAKNFAKAGIKSLFKTRHPVKTQLGAMHFGDLRYGRDTTLGRIDGGRSTGHFGTGIYFLSDDAAKKAASEFGQGSRKAHHVDLSKYNLYRPFDESDAYRFHKELREMNRLPGIEAFDKDFLKSDKGQRLLRDIGFDAFLRFTHKFKSSDDATNYIKRLMKGVGDEKKAINHTSNYVDSLSTRFMKDMGYEGVDVQNINNFDNFEFGSVLYKEALNAK